MAEISMAANGGQTYIPFQDNIHVPTLAYTPLDRPSPLIPDLEMKQEYIDRGYRIGMQCQHFLPGVTPEMLDWWWANMEKGYYLWAPGAHKRFTWVREPWKHGFLGSAHMISESMVPGIPVFGGNGIQIDRLGLDMFPFKTHLKHVLVEGIFNRKGEFVDSTVHMWEEAAGGSIHITASFFNTKITEPPAFILENPDARPQKPEDAESHAEYEASQWPVFLPKLYDLWKNHPDPSQSVPCDLRVREKEDGVLEYIAENGPVTL